MADYLPRPQLAFLNFTKNFSNRISGDAAAYGLSPEQAAGYALEQARFAEALRRSLSPDTRTPVQVLEKEALRDRLTTMTRELVRLVQAQPGMSNEKRTRLGITLRDVREGGGGGALEAVRSVPPPRTSPVVQVVEVRGHRVTLRLRDEVHRDRRRRPDGVVGATLMYHVGDNLPTTRDGWSLLRGTNRLGNTIDLSPMLPPGTRVWFTAFWYNAKSQGGAWAVPVSDYVGFGGFGGVGGVAGAGVGVGVGVGVR